MFTTDPIHAEIDAGRVVLGKVPTMQGPAQPGCHLWCPWEEGLGPGQPLSHYYPGGYGHPG